MQIFKCVFFNETSFSSLEKKNIFKNSVLNINYSIIIIVVPIKKITYI